MIRNVPVLDGLSILVMLEHCDFDYTIATFWHTRYWGAKNSLLVNGRQVDGSYHAAPIKAMWCLHCVLDMVSRYRSDDGRAALIEAVKDGAIQIEALAVRDDITRCEKCQKPAPTVNPLWKESL